MEKYKLMLITEDDLQTFQICPRRLSFKKQNSVDSNIILSSHHFIAVWMWTYQIIHEKKVSDRALKEKWASTVKSKYKDLNQETILNPVTDFIATGFPLVKQLYEEYLDSPYIPVASMLPSRYVIEHVGTINCNLEVICMNELENQILLNFSEDNQLHDTTTNLLFKTRLLAGKQIGITQLINTRLDTRLKKTYINTSDIDTNSINKQLSFIIQGIKDKIDYPILNCRLECPYKEICI